MAMFRLDTNQQDAFVAAPEVFQGIQLGYFEERSVEGYCIILSAVVAVVIDANLYSELDQFVGATWRLSQPVRGFTLAGRYSLWREGLAPVRVVFPIDTNRADMISLLTTPNPPHPARRPSLSPGAPHGRGSLPPVAAHLPFHTRTEDDEVFYRWESWPTSKRFNQSTNTVAPWTFVSPRSEIPFATTGFSAVSRMALPSFFPAMFRWRINPQLGTSILCGAVVPMFGQSGGGVEACFDTLTTNTGPIANPVALPAL
jgi:hypothetical protein